MSHCTQWCGRRLRPASGALRNAPNGPVDTSLLAAFSARVRSPRLKPLRATLVAVALSACTLFQVPASDPVIDTWSVGGPLDCAEERSCDDLIPVGLAGLAERNPGHAPVVATHLHREGAIIDPATGDQLLRILQRQLAAGCSSSS